MRRVMQVQARNEAKSSGIRHCCWFQAPFDIFDENVLQPSRKKRAAFAATLHDINPSPICDSSIFKKEKNNYSFRQIFLM